MQRGLTTTGVINDGDARIYAQHDSTKKRDSNETFGHIPAHRETNPGAAILSIKSAELSSSSSSQAELQLDATRRVLETLDEQINNLDKLQQRNHQHHRLSTTHEPSNFSYDSRLDDNNYPQARALTSGSQNYEHHYRALARAIEARKLALDHYIEHSLREKETGECGCHFEHDTSRAADCVCAPEINCQTSLSDAGQQNSVNLLDYIEQQQQQIDSDRSASTLDEIEQSCYKGRELFIDSDKFIELGPASELVHQGAAKLSQNSNDEREVGRYFRCYLGPDQAAASSGDENSIDSAEGEERRRNLSAIERKYSQRLIGFRTRSNRKVDPQTEFDTQHSERGYLRESTIGDDNEERELLEIGNALVDCDSRSDSSSQSLGCSGNRKIILRQQIESQGGQLLATSPRTTECSLTDNNNNNNENNSSSSSSLSLSWSQDFLQTFNLEDDDDDREAQLLINSLLPRSCSEGRVDFERDALDSRSSISGNSSNSQSFESREATNCSGTSGSDSDSDSASQSAHGPNKLHKQQQQQRRHSTGRLGLHKGFSRFKGYTASEPIRVADELDPRQSITGVAGDCAPGNRFALPASFESGSSECCQCLRQCQPSIIEPDGGQHVYRRATAPAQSMRAVRDIVKMSAPSLSALQYLPSQMDQFKAGKPSDDMADQEGPPTGTHPKQQLKVIEETGSTKHDESCLFHRLCMCSCVARQQAHLGADHDEDNLSRSTGCSRSPEGRKVPAKGRKSNRKRPQSESGSPSSSRAQLGDEQEQEQEQKKKQDHERSLSKPNSEEKQSPRFLSLLLLRPSSPNKQPIQSELAKRAPRQKLNELSSNPLHLLQPKGPKSSSRLSGSLGSDGNLIQSRASSSAQDDEDEDDFSEPESGCSSGRLNRSPSSLSSSAVSPANSSGRPPHESQARSKSACSTRPDEQEGETKSKAAAAAYRRFLSPRRIFATSPTQDGTKLKASKSSKVGLESLVEREPKTEKGSKSHRSSFLSRSLTRLTSQRTARALSPTQEKPAAEDNSQPAINLDTISSSSSSLPSFDRPQALAGARHLASAAPEIVLNTVEFTDQQQQVEHDDSDSISSSSATMTRLRSSQTCHHLTSASPSGDELSLLGCASSLPASPRRSPRRITNHRGNHSPRLRESPVLFRSPAAMSTKIEDGLRVCSTEHFEKHIDNVKGSQDDAQAKLFKAWINYFHPNLIRHDLVDEFRDGIKLIGLLATLTRDKELRAIYERLSNDKQSYVNRLVTTPSSRLRQLSNVSIAIDYLRQKRRMKLVNLNPMDIVSGKPNVILGLCWNLILNFQLDQQINLLPSSSATMMNDDHEDYNHNSGFHHNFSSSQASYCTSRLSNSSTNEDSSKPANLPPRRSPASSVSKHSHTGSLIEEYGTNDLISAKRKLLERINRRFNLKLTNLTSNLLDGDVLLAIMRRLVPDMKGVDSIGRQASEENYRSWNEMSNEEKLDCCFDMAETHLGIPRLFDGSDLKSPDGTKSSLIYLSMLLNSEQQTIGRQHSATSQQQQQQIPDKLVQAAGPALSKKVDPLAQIESYLDEIDEVEDKFEIGQLDCTLKKIKTLEELVDSQDATTVADGNRKILDRCQRLKGQANQIESLIRWINEADSLLESAQQRSSKDLVESIERYREFFSPQNLPKLETTLCPTLERQYRECLSSAKQRVLSMEQTLKNWISYEEARKQLKEWLILSESKLSSALDPIPFQPTEGEEQVDEDGTQSHRKSPLARHSDRLNDLIEFFELEDVDDDQNQQQQFVSEQIPISLMMSMHDVHPHESVSLSGSLISLGSTSSRMSTLQSSKRASYHKLFDDFELKCRLLAAMLDREQRESLLLGVRELRCRLRLITEQRVPQVISELRMSIGRCEMSIQEHENEDCDDYEPEDMSRSPSEQELAEFNEDVTRATHQGDILGESGCEETSDVSRRLMEQEAQDPIRCPVVGDLLKAADEPTDQPFIVSPTTNATNKRSGKSNRNTSKKAPKSRKSRKRAKAITRDEPTEVGDSDIKSSVARRIWRKLVRAFRTSLPLNIVLLVCLAGLCVVPMIQKDACCGMGQQQIATTSNDIKPV